MIEHNKNFYSLEELKRTKDSLEGYLDNEEVYYFVGAIRYACDEIERLNNIINELKKWLEEQHQFIIKIPAYTKEISIEHKTMEICYGNVLDKLQELKGSESNE